MRKKNIKIDLSHDIKCTISQTQQSCTILSFTEEHQALTKQNTFNILFKRRLNFTVVAAHFSHTHNDNAKTF